jgi:MazG family protein
MAHQEAAQGAIGRLLDIMDKLRDPGGCPWDREQTLRSLTPYLLEEAHEVIEAIEAGDAAHHREELGDLLFQVVFQSRIAREEGKFDFASVCDTIAEKLTRRHPHVFGDVTVSGSREVVKNWERIKADERKAKGESPRSAIGGVPVGLPALVRAERITEKAAAVGFDWPDVQGVLAKVREELSELDEAMGGAPAARRGRARARRPPLRAREPRPLREGPPRGGPPRGGAAVRVALPPHRGSAPRAGTDSAREHARGDGRLLERGEIARAPLLRRPFAISG